MKIRVRAAIIGVIVVVIALAILTYASYVQQRDILTDTLDAKLLATARLSQSILPAGYHDHIHDASSVSERQYLGIVHQWNQLCLELDLEYIWSVMALDGQIVFTSGTSTSKHVSRGDHAAFLAVHSNPGPYRDVLAKMEIAYLDIEDEWGKLRAVLVPFRDANGRAYIMGASVRRDQVRALALRALWPVGTAGVVAVVLFAGLGLWTISLDRRRYALERRYADVLRAAHDGVIVVGLDGAIELFSPGAERLFDCPAEEAEGAPISRFCPQEHLDEQVDVFRRVRETGAVASYRSIRVTADGRRVPIELSINLRVDESKHPVGYVGIIRDVSDRVRQEGQTALIVEALRESEARFRQIYDHMAVGVARVSLDDHIEAANDACCRMLGYDEQELIGMHLGEISHAEAVEEDLALQSQLAVGQIDHYRMEKRFIHKSGRTLYGILDANLVRHADGEPHYFLISLLDITEHKLATQALEASEALYRATVDSLGTALHLVDSDLRLVLVNAETERWGDQVGIPGPFKGRLLAEAFPFVTDREVALYRRVLETGETQISQEVSTLGGKAIVTDVQRLPVTLWEGTPGVLTTVTDVTERVRTEEALRASEARFATAFRSAPLLMSINSVSDGHYVDVNDAFVRSTGYTREQAQGRVPRDLGIISADDWAEMVTAIEGSGRFARDDFSLWRADGQRMDCLFVAEVVSVDGDEQVLATALDLTERRRAERERERLLSAVEQASEAIVITDADGIIEFVNPAFERITGYLGGEAIGQNPRILKSGEQDEAFYRQMWDTLTRGEAWSGRLVNKRKDGTLYTERAVISPVRDTEGQIINYVGVKRDISDEIVREAQLRQAQRMESVGRLAGGVAHDFNNMLSVILGHAEIARDELSPHHRVRDDIDQILDATQRSADLTRQLLAFARRQTISPRVLDANETISGMLRMLQRLIGENIELIWRPGEGIWPIKMDPSQMDQVLANLCVNSRDAIDGVGTIMIETANGHLNADYCASHPGAIEGDYVQLAVSDDGCGMSAETMEHAFEPFYTTKGLGEGTGLGLATVYGIVKQNEGTIRVYSEEGIGTTFRIYLPRHTEDPTAQEAQETLTPTRGHETILLVEDEPSMLSLARTMLERLGYHVVAAGTPQEAISLAMSHEGSLDVLMTDVIMPQMNGRELADRLATQHPRMKWLFTSGYTANVIAHRGVLDQDVAFLPKPFSMAQLARRLRQVLDN